MPTNADLFMQVMLRHTPQRHALMLPPGHPTKKYNDRPGPITPALLARHLTGAITLAAPGAASAQAAVLAIDVDAGGLAAIYALLDAAHVRGLWAWGEYHHRDGLADEEQRGYVWISFNQLLPAPQLQDLGRQLIATADVPDAIRAGLDSRAHEADTRLPFAKHTHTGRFGLLITCDQCIDIDDNPAGAFDAWARIYRANTPLSHEEGPKSIFPQKPSLPHTRSEDRAAQTIHTAGPQQPLSIEEIKRRYNAASDLHQILAAAGGIRCGPRLYRCPCGRHDHGDQRPSLLISPARNPQYGAYVAQGYRASCQFAGDYNRVWDAFNIYMLLHGLTFTQMLAHARAELGLEPLKRPQSGGNGSSGTRHSEPPTRPHSPAAAPTPPSQDQAHPTRQTIRARLAEDTQLSPAARKVLLHLLSHAEAHGLAWSSLAIGTIAVATGHHRRTIQLALRELERAGYLSTTLRPNIGKRGDETNIYTFTAAGGRSAEALPTHAHPPAAAHPGAQHPPTVPKIAPPPAHMGRGGRSNRSPNMNLDHESRESDLNGLVRGGDPHPVPDDTTPASPPVGNPPLAPLAAAAAPEAAPARRPVTLMGAWRYRQRETQERQQQECRQLIAATSAPQAEPVAPPAADDQLADVSRIVASPHDLSAPELAPAGQAEILAPTGLAGAELAASRQTEIPAVPAPDGQAGAKQGATFTPVDYTTWPAPAEWRHELRPSEYYERFRAMDELATRHRALSAPPLQAQPTVEIEPAVLEQAELETSSPDLGPEVPSALGLAALREEVRRRQREAVRVAKISPSAAGRLWQSYHRLRRMLAEQEQLVADKPPAVAPPRAALRVAPRPTQVALGEDLRYPPAANDWPGTLPRGRMH